MLAVRRSWVSAERSAFVGFVGAGFWSASNVDEREAQACLTADPSVSFATPGDPIEEAWR
jgi:hypothetical protein